jgi:chitinase
MRIIFVISGFLALLPANFLKAQSPKKIFDVIGYYSGNGDNINDYDVSGLTQVIFSFLHLKDDTLSFSSPGKMEALRKTVALKKNSRN